MIENEKRFRNSKNSGKSKLQLKETQRAVTFANTFYSRCIIVNIIIIIIRGFLYSYKRGWLHDSITI